MSDGDDRLPIGWIWGETWRVLIAHDGVFSDGDWVESKDQDRKGDVRSLAGGRG